MPLLILKSAHLLGLSLPQLGYLMPEEARSEPEVW